MNSQAERKKAEDAFQAAILEAEAEFTKVCIDCTQPVAPQTPLRPSHTPRMQARAKEEARQLLSGEA